MQDVTYQYLADRGFARGEARANTGALADACIAKMLERVVTTTDVREVQGKGLLASELRELVLGVPDDDEIETDLDGLVARILSPEGTIQNRLENGLNLCSARVNRVLMRTNGNESETVTRLARFLSDVPDVIEAFYLLPQHDAAVRTVQGLNGRWERAISRHPEMAARRQAFISKTAQRLALELGTSEAA